MTTAQAPTAKVFLALGLAAMLLSACNTRANPANWFRGSEQVDLQTGEVNPLVPEDRQGVFERPEGVYAGLPVEQVVALRIEPTRTGAIILAEGLAARQGSFDARLVPENLDEEPVDGVLAYNFAVLYPAFNTPVGSESLRKVTAARSISNETLARTRVVRIIAARNVRESRR